MAIENKCWDKTIELLLENDSLTTNEFILLLTQMQFTKEIIMCTLNKLIESPLVKYIDDRFTLDL